MARHASAILGEIIRPHPDTDLIFRLRKRAEIRLQAKGRKSVEEGKPDRLADLLEEAANALEKYGETG